MGKRKFDIFIVIQDLRTSKNTRDRIFFEKKLRESILICTQKNRVSSNILLGVIPLVLKTPASIYMLSLGKALHCEALKLGVEVRVICLILCLKEMLCRDMECDYWRVYENG
ncbi:Uncharacterized protein Fot_23843 [Forsythia ovata]|uniref:Uncharacterized protein n=1 Tax=Forsythia ovata TaxID=205694 RepID=A0ABD1U5Q5_9LAMI